MSDAREGQAVREVVMEGASGGVRDAIDPRDTTGDPSAASRWLLLTVVWAIYIVTCVDRVAWGSVALSVGESLDVPLAALGVFATAFYVGYVASNVVGGPLCDRIGPRRLLVATLIPMGICTFAFGLMSSVAFGLAMQAVMGLAAGADLVAGIKIIAVWFERRQRGIALGIFLTGTSLSVVIANLVIPPGIVTVGWSGIYFALGVLTCACGLLAHLALPELPTVPRVRPTDAATAHGLLDDPRQAIQIGLVAVAGFGAFWGLWGFAFWANALMVKAAQIPPVRAGVAVATFGLGALASKPLIGLASDLLGGRRRELAIASLAGFAIALLIFGKLTTEWQFLIMAPALGFLAFAPSPMLYAIVTEQAGPARSGLASGFANAFWQLGSLVVPLAVGYAFQATGQSFYAAFVVLAAGPIVAIVCMLFVREGETDAAIVAPAPTSTPRT